MDPPSSGTETIPPSKQFYVTLGDDGTEVVVHERTVPVVEWCGTDGEMVAMCPGPNGLAMVRNPHYDPTPPKIEILGPDEWIAQHPSSFTWFQRLGNVEIASAWRWAASGWIAGILAAGGPYWWITFPMIVAFLWFVALTIAIETGR